MKQEKTHPNVSTGEKSREKENTNYIYIKVYTLLGKKNLSILIIVIQEIR